MGLKPSLTEQHWHDQAPPTVSHQCSQPPGPQQAKQVHSQEQGQLKHTKRKSEGPWPHLQQRRAVECEKHAGREAGPPGSSLLAWVIHFCTGTKNHLRAAEQTPGLVLECQLLSLPSQTWGNPLGRVARNPKPYILRFQCLGRFQNLDRTSVCQTQNRQAWRE